MEVKVRRARGHIERPDREIQHRLSWEKHAGNLLKMYARATPATFDCTSLCTPIKDQSQCGSCWDFSGTCVVESANIKVGNLPNTLAGQLSEQYTLDQCDGANGGCDGDDNTTVLADAKTGGLPLTSDYGPYRGVAGTCKWNKHERIRNLPDRTTGAGKLYTLSDWGYVGPQSGVAAINDIKTAMITYGPIGCAVAADDNFENYQPGTVYQGDGNTSIDHDVVLCGWDDTKQAWLMRNSWGLSWGNAGYMWIAYGANQIGWEAVWGVATPINPPVPPTPVPPVPPTPTPTPAYDVGIDLGAKTVSLTSGVPYTIRKGQSEVMVTSKNVALTKDWKVTQMTYIHAKFFETVQRLGNGYTAIPWTQIMALLEQLGLQAIPLIEPLLVAAGVPGWLISMILAALASIIPPIPAKNVMAKVGATPDDVDADIATLKQLAGVYTQDVAAEAPLAAAVTAAQATVTKAQADDAAAVAAIATDKSNVNAQVAKTQADIASAYGL